LLPDSGPESTHQGQTFVMMGLTGVAGVEHDGGADCLRANEANSPAIAMNPALYRSPSVTDAVPASGLLFNATSSAAW
jgi:hypothetical protein